MCKALFLKTNETTSVFFNIEATDSQFYNGIIPIWIAGNNSVKTSYIEFINSNTVICKDFEVNITNSRITITGLAQYSSVLVLIPPLR